MATQTGEYSVCQFFENDTHEYVLRFVDAETAVVRAAALAKSVGGRIGTTKRIIITDAGDSIVFEWIHGQGIVYPPDLVEKVTGR